MDNKKSNLINIVAQAFYGNRNMTEINPEKVDRFILGHLDDNIPSLYPIDRSIIKIPNTNIVLVYNKHSEEERRKLKERVLIEENYVIKPLAFIQEENIELYSRCIACRINEDGELESLQEEDYNKLINYLAE